MTQQYKMLARAVDRVAMPLCIIDAKAERVRYTNKAFVELFGSDPKKTSQVQAMKDYFTGLRKLGLMPTEVSYEQFQGVMAQTFASKKEVQMTREGNDGRYFRLDMFPEAEHDLVITYTDITDLEVAVRDAKKAEVAKSEFMANMSHEIRTPMNGVLGMAQILSNTELTDHQEKCLNVISRSGNALITIINDILDFSKIEAGQLSLCPEPFDLRDAVEDVMSLLGHSAQEKGIELIADIPASIPHQFIGDSGRLRQILINLIGNAIKYTGEGYVKMSVRGAEGGSDMDLTFDVEDTGIGIDPDKVGRIFNQFEQADNSTTRKYGGTGLGLTISRCLVEAMNGSIGVTSEPGKGSVFTFTVALPVGQSGREGRFDFKSLGNIPILIIDDLPVNREIISNQVAQMGAGPYAVPSAKAALALMKKAAQRGHRFPAVISDFQMPDMDGLDFARAVRADAAIAATPIMILSSVDLSSLKTTLKDYGVKHAITKPASVKDIYTELVKAVDCSGLKKPAPSVVQTPEKPSTKVRHEITPRTGQSDRAVRILAADDDAVNRMVIEGMLARENIKLTIVVDGQDAVDAASLNDYDIILMDVDMPIMDGLDAVSHIRDLEQRSGKPRVPIIATTAHALEHDRERFLQSGMDDYIPKPIQDAQLFAVINKWLAWQPDKSIKVA